MNPLPHLDEYVSELVRFEPPSERIYFVQNDHWIRYDVAESILADMLAISKQPKVNRMPCLAITGRPNNGKSSLIDEYIKQHGLRDEDGRIFASVIAFEMPPEPNEKRLYSAILRSLQFVHRPDAAPDVLLSHLLNRMTTIGVRLLIADEFHNMIAGTSKDQKQFLISLKSLLNQLQVGFVAVGTDAVTTALAVDPQFVARFKRIDLPTWELNKTMLQLLLSLEQIMPLPEPSGLGSRELAPLIVRNCNGTIGSIVSLVKAATIAAINQDLPCITADLVKVVAERISQGVISA